MKKTLNNNLRCLIFILLFAGFSFAQDINPCANIEIKAFDFQIGVWQNKNGTSQHEIKKILGGCGIQEIWKKDGLENAFALKTFDSGRHNANGEQKWFYSWTAAGFHQIWEGRKEEGQWRFYREWINEGQKVLSRTYWNLLPDSSIDRIVEQSLDGGKSWKLHFKENFTRKN